MSWLWSLTNTCNNIPPGTSSVSCARQGGTLVSLSTFSWSLLEPWWTRVASSDFHRLSFQVNWACLVCKDSGHLPCSLWTPVCLLKCRVMFAVTQRGLHARSQFSLLSTARFPCASVFGTANICILCCIFRVFLLLNIYLLYVCIRARTWISCARTWISYVHLCACVLVP